MSFRVYTAANQVPAGFGPSALTIGNFDGVHAGHARILGEVVDAARAGGFTPSALTFDPHPTTVVAPERAPQLLTTVGQRVRLFEQAGIEAVLVLPFTPEVAALTPAEFVGGILVERLAARVVVVGDNFRFGRGQSGAVADLESCGQRLGFEVRIVQPVVWRGEAVSSSSIRKLVAAGDVARAARLLGRVFCLEGGVAAGHGVGARRTVPTLNLAPQSGLLPARGVYITCTQDLGSHRRWPSVTNVGFRPTFGGTELTIETHLLEPLEGADPVRIEVAFWGRIRDEIRFPTPEALRGQILRDVATAQRFFRRLRAAQTTKEILT